MLAKQTKNKIITKYKTHVKDTGSPEVQVALLSKSISELAAHLKKNPKDIHSRKGLLGMVSRRKKLLDFLKKESMRRHNSLVKKLKI
ncbi:MAG: 30S ribosomal protein S15 [Candidatus Parcubacteria bacterium]|nr:30S ribosomal protein S15 [Candidatus Parcubacteria bacterium]